VAGSYVEWGHARDERPLGLEQRCIACIVVLNAAGRRLEMVGALGYCLFGRAVSFLHGVIWQTTRIPTLTVDPNGYYRMPKRGNVMVVVRASLVHPVKPSIKAT
jgi:hypothetical protein